MLKKLMKLEKALTRRMREIDKQSLAKCGRGCKHAGLSTGEDLEAFDFAFQDEIRWQDLKMQLL